MVTLLFETNTKIYIYRNEDKHLSRVNDDPMEYQFILTQRIIVCSVYYDLLEIYTSMDTIFKFASNIANIMSMTEPLNGVNRSFRMFRTVRAIHSEIIYARWNTFANLCTSGRKKSSVLHDCRRGMILRRFA